MKVSIYVERSGGRYNACFWHTDEQRYYYFRGHDSADAIRRCAKATGYPLRDCKIVRMDRFMEGQTMEGQTHAL